MKTYFILAVLQALLLGIQGISYLMIQKFQGPYHDMARPVDRKIPLVPQAVLVYVLWYPLIAVYPLYLFSCSPIFYSRYILAIVLDIIISLSIYLCYPSSFVRPAPPSHCLSGKILGLMYVVDYKGLNCMPSMHCSQCFIIIMSAVMCGLAGMMPLAAAVGVSSLGLAIIGSTVLTKQHVLIDMGTAVPLGIGCWLLGMLILQN